VTLQFTSTLEPKSGQIASQPVGILRGMGSAGDPLYWIGCLMLDKQTNNQHRWVIDNRDARKPLALVELMRFANQVKSQPERFIDISIAWVAGSSIGPCLRDIAESLPLAFEEFKSFDDAIIWLHEQP